MWEPLWENGINVRCGREIRPFWLRDKNLGIPLSEMPERKACTSNFA